MKQNKNKDISILLYALLLFSFGIGWIYSKHSIEEKSAKPNLDEKQIETNIDSGESPNNKTIIETKTLDNKIPEDKTKTPEAKNLDNKTTETLKSETKAQETKTIEIKKTEIPEFPKPPVEIKESKKDPQEDKPFTTEEILSYTKELMESKGIDEVIKILKVKCKKNIVVQTLKELLKQYDEELSLPEKLKIILSLGKYHENDKNLEGEIFNIILEDKNLKSSSKPLLVMTTEIGQSKTIENLIQWYKKTNKPDLKNIAEKNLEYASKFDNLEALKQLIKMGKIEIKKDFATKLLWINLISNKGHKSIKYLKELGADLNNIDNTTKLTPLILAIKNKNFGQVKELVKLGANLELSSPDNAIGSPLQVARELELIDIENYLQSKNAKY